MLIIAGVTSATQWNRKHKPSLAHRDTELIYGPKYFYENFRKQLRICSTPGGHKAEKSHIETGKKSHFNLYMTAPSPSAYLSLIQFLFQGKEKWNLSSMI